ncbi:GIN domain-containing protein [Swaminathania salitolerans]|uniref:Putative auto-transporter adhesin head GIN domain-containing protein n=1 Tax=Swaminathania salitolerans TaxID=182838 RepID=A0A511BQA2_9PROT|nr:DUF2807 domain-containing protein [Swaminathania salitolerans]GBQ11364.1 hypothetical protein AA21291_0785 [Swaminathania salitolerans LMG 21291]GEL02445.1 hypothetical protein SSA02_16080 [Swaminathania salitolerans]
MLSAAPYTLHVATGCAADIRIRGLDRLDGMVDMRDIPSGLSLSAAAHDAWLTGDACGEDATIRVKTGTAVVVTAMNYDSLTIGWVDGPVAARQGRGTLRIDKATALIYRGSGPGDLTLDTLAGPALLALSGPGDITIGTARAPSFDLSQTGPGDLEIRHGTIDRLTFALSGSGDAFFDGVAHEAALQTGGPGDIRVREVRDALHSHSTGPGTITVVTPPPRLTHKLPQQSPHSPKKGARGKTALILPDGTVIDAHRMTKADGTVVDFDALRQMSARAIVSPRPSSSRSSSSQSSSSGSTGTEETPSPPGPPSPPERPSGTGAAHAPVPAVADEESEEESGLGSGIVLLVVLALALLRRRIVPPLIRWLHRISPTLGKRLEPALMAVAARPSKPEPSTQLPELLALTERLQRLDRRVGNVESCLTSREFHLHRQLEALDRQPG